MKKRSFWNLLQATGTRVERNPRLRIIGLPGISLFVDDAGTGIPEGDHVILNASNEGIGLARTRALSDYKQDAAAAARLVIGKESYPVRLKIAHVSLSSVGCEVSDFPGAATVALDKLLTETLGTLKLEAAPAKEGFVLEGPHGIRIEVITARDRSISGFKMHFLGNYIEGDGHEIRCGYSTPKNPGKSDASANPDFIRFVDDDSNEQRRYARLLVQNASTLDEDIRAKLLERLR
jgi:hypothetical protein